MIVDTNWFYLAISVIYYYKMAQWLAGSVCVFVLPMTLFNSISYALIMDQNIVYAM